MSHGKIKDAGGLDRALLEEQLQEYPILEYAYIEPGQIRFLDEVRYICRTECPQYGRSWSCPPAVGTVEECRESCAHYKGGFLFTTIAEVNDIENMEETLATRMDHEEITRQVRDRFLRQGLSCQVLSTESCGLCEKCSYPSAPCRHPDRMFPCVESYGILVTELAEQSGMSFLNGPGVVTWFSLILYGPQKGA